VERKMSPEYEPDRFVSSCCSNGTASDCAATRQGTARAAIMHVVRKTRYRDLIAMFFYEQ
jgi:hypothetical protein